MTYLQTHVAGIRFLQQERDVISRGDHQGIRNRGPADAQELGIAVRGVLDDAMVRLASFQRAIHEQAVQRVLEQVFVHVGTDIWTCIEHIEVTSGPTRGHQPMASRGDITSTRILLLFAITSRHVSRRGRDRSKTGLVVIVVVVVDGSGGGGDGGTRGNVENENLSLNFRKRTRTMFPCKAGKRQGSRRERDWKTRPSTRRTSRVQADAVDERER